MARSPLIETYKRVEGMVAYVRENLNPGEYDLFLDMVAPEPEPEAPKQTRKKRAARTPKQAGLPKAEAGNGALCIAQVPGLDVPCGNVEENPIHDPNGGYGGYHPFVLSAPAAEPRSSRRRRSTKAKELSTPSSETPLASVGNAVHEASSSASAGD